MDARGYFLETLDCPLNSAKENKSLCQKDHGDHRNDQDQRAEDPPDRIFAIMHSPLQSHDRCDQCCQTAGQGDQHGDEPPEEAAQDVNRRQSDDKKENRHDGRKDEVADNSFHLIVSC